ncbi:hypothetical protein AB0C59_19655 [Streptomyces sp. NPDC048664]|uniref:hypothetical protein n=1 Tax=Streptomyces sp. NPDC048664 TaxID=3154505 RepID=UPI00341F6E95
MRHTATACLFTAAVLTLTGCSLAGSGGDGPAKPGSGASAAAAGAEQIAACRDAIVAQKDNSADNGLPQCAQLSPDDYLKALKEADQQGKGTVQKAPAQDSTSAQP